MSEKSIEYNALNKDEFLRYMALQINTKSRINELDLLKDEKKFITNCYFFFFDREASFDEIKQSKKLLKSGLSKKGFIYYLWISKEHSRARKLAHIKEYKDDFLKYKWDASFLTKYKGTQFIKECYNFILGREADESGMELYLDCMDRGFSKKAVVYMIASSPEGLNARKIKHIKDYAMRYKKDKLRVKLSRVGKKFKKFGMGE